MPLATPPGDRTTPIVWNDPEIIKAAGAQPEAVRKLLSRHKQPLPTDDAIYQWVSRRKIAGIWRPKLIYCLMRENLLDVATIFAVSK